MQIHTIPEYDEIVPKQRPDEFRSLVTSIKEKGQQYSIIVNSNGIVLDGHHRFRACQQLGIESKYEIKDFEDQLDEEEFVIYTNFARRNLNDFQRSELGKALEAVESKRAKKRQEQLGRTHGKVPVEADPSCSNEHKGTTRKAVADKIGVSETTYYRSRKILESANKELIDKVESGQTSINYAYKTVTRKEEHIETPDLPEGEYDIIMADPPWAYDINTRGSPDEHYQTMTNKDIEELQIPSSDSAILFLWATNPKLPEALNVLKKWGFKYKTAAVWIKDKIGTGYYFRGQHELLLVGEKGEMPVPEEKNRPSSIIKAPRQEHSKKPDIYNIIESMYPNRTYLELFARNTKEGWVSWGNELN